MKKIIIFIIFICISILSYGGNSEKKLTKEDMEKLHGYIQQILKKKGEKEANDIPISTKTVMMGIHTEVIVPLEVISDIDIDTMVVDDQDVVIPFEVELSKTPDKKNLYKLQYSEKNIDIDRDGKIDTHIYSNKHINSKIQKDNFVLIRGRNITKEGRHEKIVYIDVETKD